MGVNTTPRDWLRIGIYLLERLTQDDCLAEYLKAATREQIVANWSFNKSYGYQIWTQCTSKPGSFCFLDNHGQQLIMDPATETVMYVHATSSQTNGLRRNVFARVAR